MKTTTLMMMMMMMVMMMPYNGDEMAFDNAITSTQGPFKIAIPIAKHLLQPIFKEHLSLMRFRANFESSFSRQIPLHKKWYPVIN